jgi:UDP-glucose 4-epimerase
MINLVIGGAGFVGVNLSDMLMANGETVVCIDNFSRFGSGLIDRFLSHDYFSYYELDCTDEQGLNTVFKNFSDHRDEVLVWHLAANSDIPAGIDNLKIDVKDTFLSTAVILNCMKQVGFKKIFFASSSAVYGDHGGVALRENSGPLNPISNYGAMKLASEAMLSACTESFLELALVFRFPNVVGVPATHGVIYDFINRLRENGSVLEVLGDGSQRKVYLHVSDLIDALIHLRKLGRVGFEVFNIGPSDDGVTVQAIAEEVCSVFGGNPVIKYGSDRKGWVGDVPRFRYDVRKIGSVGWQSSRNSREAIELAASEICQSMV